MGILDRYKKQGGFKALLFLLETCGPQKQAKLLESVRSDSPSWADALAKKILTVRRIFSWDASALGIIFKEIQDLTLAYVICGLDEKEKESAFSSCSKREQQKILEILEFQKPNSAEISTAYRKFIESVRDLIESGILDVQSLDPSLVIEPDLERHLSEKPEATHSHQPGSSSFFQKKTNQLRPTEKSGAKLSKNEAIDDPRLKLLIKDKINTDQENLKLKNEIAELNNKIDRIKKLLAS